MAYCVWLLQPAVDHGRTRTHTCCRERYFNISDVTVSSLKRVVNVRRQNAVFSVDYRLIWTAAVRSWDVELLSNSGLLPPPTYGLRHSCRDS